MDDVIAATQQMLLPPVADVLDVATGAGHTGLYFAGLGHRVTLADIAQPMLDRALEAATERGLKITTQQHAAEKFPYANGSFDLVTCRVAPHHFSSPPDFVNEAARVLRPGGYFLLIDGSVPDDEPEAEAWLHEVEKLRDPSHNRLLSPRSWTKLCVMVGLKVNSAELKTFKQPDLEWYFETANTPQENRVAVRRLVETASKHVRECYRVAMEAGKTVWWWPRLTLIAQR
ncbi:MAG TPA: class I SAM-dependent methyltransferase [Verrucomicrobiae bacterium]